MELKELTAVLLEAPRLIAHADNLVVHWKREVLRFQAAADALEAHVMASKPAKEWGSNEGERKVSQAVALRGHGGYMEVCKGLDQAKHELALAEAGATMQRNQFSAYRAVAELMAADRLGDRTITSAANGHRIYSEVGL